MSSTLTIRNHHRKRPVNVRLLRQIARALLQDLLQIETFDLGIYLVATPDITRLNQTFLRHKGSTDVITFDYSPSVPPRPRPRPRNPNLNPALALALCPNPKHPPSPLHRPTNPPIHQSINPFSRAPLHAEIFICLDEAIAQARRFRTTWQSELIRYVTHALLHLQGFDDQRPTHRRQMKRTEDRLLGQLARLFNLADIAELRRSR